MRSSPSYQYRVGTELRDSATANRFPMAPVKDGLRSRLWRLVAWPGAGLRDLREHLLLLAEVLLHAFEEVRDQVVPPLELDAICPTPRPHYVAARARCKWRWRITSTTTTTMITISKTVPIQNLRD